MHSFAMWALSLSCRLLREVSNLAGRQARQGEEYKSLLGMPDIVGAFFVYVWRTFEGGSTRSPLLSRGTVTEST